MSRTHFLVPILSLALGCAPPGDVTFTVWGESYIPHGIPARTATAAGLENGWSVTYSRFLVHLGAVRVAGTDADAGGSAIAEGGVWDLVQVHDPLDVGTLTGLAAKRWSNVSYEIIPATVAGTLGNASSADRARMVQGGFSVVLEGSARKGTDAPYTFAWTFTRGVRMHECKDANEQLGLVVPPGGRATIQLTIHGDHPFYDDLGAPDASLRFDAFAAADTNGDRVITQAELAAVELSTLPAGQYGTSGAPGVHTLADFLAAEVATIGHYDGEGHCAVTRL